MRSSFLLLAASIAAVATWALLLDRVGGGDGPPLVSPPAVGAPRVAPGRSPLSASEVTGRPELLAAAADRVDAARAGLSTVAWNGRLEDARTGAPVVDAVVRLALGELAVETRSRGDGSFELEGFDDRGASLLVAHPGYVDLREAEPALREGRIFRLAPSGALRGVVLGPGAGREGLEVGLWRSAGRRLDGPPLATVKPDAERAFRFDDLEPGAYGLGVIGDDVPLVFQDGVLVRPPEEAFVRLTVGAGLALAGRTVLRDGPPIAGAEVTVLPEIQGINDGIERLSARVVETGEDGRFRLEGLAEGGLDVAVRTPWGASRRARANVSSFTAHEERVFTFPAPARISGVVRGTNGAPAIVGVVSEADRDRRGRLAETVRAGRLLDEGAVRTGPDGRFLLERVPAEERLWIFAAPGDEDPEGSAATSLQLEPLAEGATRDDLELTLATTSTRLGRVVDAEERPLAGVRVELWRELVGDRQAVETAETDAAGEFVIGGASGTEGFLLASLDGYARGWRRLEELAPDERVEIRLEPAPAVRGRVVDEAGFAVPGVSVELRRDRRNSRSDTSDEYGRFAIERLAAGEYELRVGGDGWRLTGPAERPPVVVPFEGELLLEVSRGPLEAPVRVVGEVLDGDTRGPVPNLRLDGFRGGTVTIAGARFDLEGMRPGEASLELEAAGYETWRTPARDYAPGAQVDLGTFELWRAGEVRLRVLDSGGAAVRGATVRLKPLSHLEGGVGLGRDPVTIAENRRDRDWPYRLDGVPRRKFELEIQRRGFETHREIVTLSERRNLLAVRLERLEKRDE